MLVKLKWIHDMILLRAFYSSEVQYRCMSRSNMRADDDDDGARLPRVRVRCTGVRHMHEADPCVYARAAHSRTESTTTPWSRPPPPLALDKPFFFESEHSDSPFVLRVVNNCVAFVHRGTHVIERSFVFPDRVIDAVVARFETTANEHNTSNTPARSIRNSRRIRQHTEPHLCVLVRSDCVNIYTPTGDVFEAALPFQANRLFALGTSGLLLQRSPAAAQLSSPRGRARRDDSTESIASTLLSDSTRASLRPRFFTLAHPLDEVKPLALGVARAAGTLPFVSDPALEIVAFIASHALLVCFHTATQCFHVFGLTDVPVAAVPRVTPVRVVDAQTWQRHREHALDAHDRVTIAPDWQATAVWTSPACRTKRKATSTTDRATRSAFIATDVDDAALLGLVDRAARVLLLKRLDDFTTMSASDEEPTVFERSEATANDSVSVLRCRAAVPLSLTLSHRRACAPPADASDDATDIVVLLDNGTMRLHRGALAICELVPPDLSSEDAHCLRPWAATTEIRSIVATHSRPSNATSFEVCDHDALTLPDTIVRCDHPLQFAFAPLLERVFRVLECVLPATVVLPLRAAVVASVQSRQTDAEQDTTDARSSAGDCDWRVFCELVECAIGSSRQDDHSMSSSSDDSAPHATEASAFDQLCRSTFHGAYSAANALLLSHMDVPPLATPSTQAATVRAESLSPQLASSLRSHASTVFAALHLLHEDLQLSVASSEQRQQLAHLLLELSARLSLRAFSFYYEHAAGRIASIASAAATSIALSESLFSSWRGDCVPDILDWIASQIRHAGRERASEAPLPFPTLSHLIKTGTQSAPARTHSPLWRTAAVCRVYELLLASCDSDSTKDSDNDNGDDKPTAPDRSIAASRMELMAFLTRDAVGAQLTLEDLPLGVQFPVVEAIRAFRHAPPPFVTDDICDFIGREDLAGVVATRYSSEHVASSDQLSYREAPSASASLGHHSDRHGTSASTLEPDESDDGLDDVVQRSQSLFPHDQRLKEVARLVRSSRPLCLKLEKTADVSDQDYVLQQQARLLLLCKRSMALSVARGMVTLGGFDVHKAQDHAWQLRVPALPLAGRTPPTNAIVALDVSGYAKELTFWPQFHNGCAAGLRLPARDLSSVVNRYWIKYHRPSVAEHHAKAAARQSASTNAAAAQTPPSPEDVKRSLEEAYAAHAGLLLGLGLRGHLQCLSMADVYNYLSLSNEFVTVAILLGMATTAAHCRQRRVSSGATTSSSPRDDAAVADAVLNDEDDDDDDDSGDRSRFHPATKTPLVGSGLELTLERSVSKMLCLHIPSLLPPPFAEFSVPASTQTAALLGLGILYQGSGHRLMTELLLTEIARSPSSAQFVSNNTNSGLSTASFDQLEGYALAAGLALGLVVLGRGHTKSGDPGLADMKLEEKLHQYIAGGAQQFGDASAAGGCLYRGRKWSTFGSGSGALSTLGDRSDGATSGASGTSVPGRDFKSYTDRSSRGSEHVNVGVTACGSALALAFMYLQTDNRSIAAQLAVPDTLILLDAVRPDILLVRTLATNLVLWHSVEPTVAWIEDAQVPAQLLEAYRALERAPHGAATRRSTVSTAASIHSDAQSICEAYANVVAGACFSIGLRFAGTADARARTTLRTFVLHFRDLRTRAAVAGGRVASASTTVAGATERVTIERCLAVCAQALALVDAGTGDVETLTLLRSINLRQRVDAELTYGNHMALSSAIGLLFLGGGRATVARTRDAIAALVIALFPMYAMNTADNKYHLQAFHHLYVLAVDTSRLVEAIDVNTGANCSVAVQLELEQPRVLGVSASTWRTLQSPCLLPELSAIRRIVIASDAFYPVEILMAPPSSPSSKQQLQQRSSATTLSDSSSSSGPSSAALASQTTSARMLQKASTANALRLELLRDRNVILLKRTKHHARSDGLASISQKLQALLDSRAESHDPYCHGAFDQCDALLATFATYFMRRSATSARLRTIRLSDEDDGSAARSTWWRQQCEQVVMRHVQEDASRFLPMYLHALHALFRVQQLQSQSSLSSMAPTLLGLRNLKLFVAYRESSAHQLQSSPHLAPRQDHLDGPTDDFVVWLKLQTEHALREIWDQCGVDVATSADVYALVHRAVRAVRLTSASTSENDSMDKSLSTRDRELDLDTKFVVGALVRYFAVPGVQTGAIASRLERLAHYEQQQEDDADREWFRLESLLFDQLPLPSLQASTGSSTSTPAARSTETEASASQDERAFWLQLMSFFMVKR